MSEAAKLPLMPEPYGLCLVSSDGETVLLRGPYVVGRYEDDDLAMRNLVICSLRDAGHSGREVAACFSLSEQYVATLRARAKREGSAGLVREMGRPRTLTAGRLAKARAWSALGVTNAEIARRLEVHRGTIGRLLGQREDPKGEEQRLELVDSEEVHSDALAAVDVEEVEDEEVAPRSPLPRLGGATVPSRYSGSMLLHPFLCRLGIDDVLASLPSGTARHYDATSLVLSSTFGFALGSSSLEGSKHLVAKDAGALVGLERFPYLRTLRPRLTSLAGQCDPLALQRAFAKAMVATDEHPPDLYFVDDHFVTYWGKQSVAKGYNIRRHLAEPGRDDTFCVDQHWRAICFSSGEPRGLSVTMKEVVGQLKEITGDRPVMVGFDRGGSYPTVFTELADAGMEWVTWRRAPLVTPSEAPRRLVVDRGGKERVLLIADERVELSGYDKGPVRQLSAYEDGKVVFQVLTANTELSPGPLVDDLRHRWCIENFNKYVEDHHGVHWLSTYQMDVETNTALVANPERRAARKSSNAAKAAVSEAERSLGEAMDAHYDGVDERVAAISRRRDDVAIAKDALFDAKAALKDVPAKLPANEIDPDAKRAKPRLAPRALQMVCRLLAYNAELDLARRLNAYLADDDEYRAITRNLLHLGGTITYEGMRIVVHLHRPDAPRVARSLRLLVEELNRGPQVHISGDRRPITYELA